MVNLMRLPPELTAGDTWTIDREYSAYAPGTWSLAIYFKSAAAAFAIEGAEVTTVGAGFRAVKAAADTATLTAGRYAYQLQVTNGAVRVTLEQGEVVVLPNFAVAGNLDARSFARKALENIEAYLANANNLAAASYQIGGRTLARFRPEELMKLRKQLQTEVAREDAANGGARVGRTFVRFNAP
jgi:hypothetical protein